MLALGASDSGFESQRPDMEISSTQKIVLLVLFSITAILFYQILAPYLFSLFWACVLAGIFYPFYKKINLKIKNNNISSFATIIVVLLIVILPLGIVSGIVIKEAISFYNTINNPETIIMIKNLTNQIISHPKLQAIVSDIEIEKEFKNISSVSASFVFSQLKSLTQNTTIFIINIFVMLYALFYFLIDGKKILFYVSRLLPLEIDVKKELYQKFISTSRATLKGTIFLGIIQGVLGGITLFIIGMPSIFFYTIVMIILSIIPAVGASFVLLPIAVYLALMGSAWQVVAVLIGVIIVSSADNLLRPAMVGKDLEMHPFIIFLSTVGGLGLFGISGIVIGPIVASFFGSILNAIIKVNSKTAIEKY